MDNNQEQAPYFNEDDAVAFIYHRLIAEGYAVNEEAIRKVMELEFEYMISVGLAVPIEEE